jgi:hypothetical protein
MKTSQTIQRACKVLRHRVRFTDAQFSLSDSMSNQADTDKIREATRLYISSWVEPIIDAIEIGDTSHLAFLIRGERSTESETEEILHQR